MSGIWIGAGPAAGRTTETLLWLPDWYWLWSPGVDAAGRCRGGAIGVNAHRGRCWRSVGINIIDGGCLSATLGLRTRASADLHHTLEVDIHGVWELEGLEVCVGEHIGSRVKVFHFLERTHDLLSDHTALLINQLDWSSLSVVRNTVPHHHVKLVLVVLNPEHHGHRLSDLHDPAHLACIRTLANLYLHPASQVVTKEVRRHWVQHVHLVRFEGDGFLVEVVPCASNLPGLIP